jgi:hypothetical protein
MSPDLDLKQGISYLERERGGGRGIEIEGRNSKIAGRHRGERYRGERYRGERYRGER